MKGTRHFGTKILLFIVALGLLAHAAARGPKGAFPFADYIDWEDDSPVDTPETEPMRFPIEDRTGEPAQDTRGNAMDLKDPANIENTVEYDPETKRYYLSQKVGDQFIRNPTFLTYDEYVKQQARQDEQTYWKRRLDALTLFNKKPQLPQMYREGIFDRIFGGTEINVRPQGNVDVTLGGNWQNIQNPTLVARAQKYGVFDFDLQMNISLLATIGEKLKLNISNNTKATFDYQNVQRIDYSGKDDEILKKIEAGNIAFPLNSTLIQGVQSLFGLKTQLQFGKLWVTAAVSQQKSKRSSITLAGGAQTQSFSVKADDYEENKNFLLGQYFRDHYNEALSTLPIIRSQVTINKIEVWVTNRTGAVEGVRDLLAFMDLGEANPYQQRLADPNAAATIRSLPANEVNTLYSELQRQPGTRLQGSATNIVSATLGLTENEDFQRVTARKLNPSEYTFNPQVGFISLNATPNPDDIVAVAYRYTFNGKTYQVGEFAEDLPPDSSTQRLLFLKLLKGTSPRVNLPIWDLMMKNVYALGGFGLSREDFRLNVLYQNPGGGELRYLPEGPSEGKQLLQVLNLDRLNAQNDPIPDGVFDYVEGITINSQQGKLIFPVLEPFGKDLAPAFGGTVQLERKYLYNILYDSTKTIARQFQQNNRYVIRGTYQSSSSAEIQLNAFNIPQGSVSVTAGGQKLIENQDYQVDYGIGRLRILNTGLLNSGIPINVQYEDNATFGFQQQNFLGARFDYYANKNLTLGSTIMRLSERPFSQKVNFGEDPIQNTVIGLDATFANESRGLTRLLDKLPIYSTTAASFVNVSGEVAAILPGHPVQIDALDGGTGAVYIDDFEGTRSSYDLKFPFNSWSMASTPVGAIDAAGRELFPEARLFDSLSYGYNRARLAWYGLEPTLVEPSGGIPDYVKKDPNQHYIRLVQRQEVFPQSSNAALQSALATFDLGFYPRERGQYNFTSDVEDDGRLTAPRTRWGGIQRPVEFSDFEASNVEFMEFWVMDPFINNPGAPGGSLYINLGNVSEDVLKDSRKAFENGIPVPKDVTKLDQTRWGYVPKFQQQITRAFDNDPAARAIQDVGYDGYDDNEERTFQGDFLQRLSARLGSTNPAYTAAAADPASDNYKYYRASDYDAANTGVLGRYKAFNNPQSNSPITDASSAFSFAATTIPESEDINRDNTLNESEDYFQYRIDMFPSDNARMQVGENFIVNKQSVNVKLPNGQTEAETWYQFKVPIREYQAKVGGIGDFRSIRFMRLFLNGFEDSVILRFARLELGRNQWRRYDFSLAEPGENIPDIDKQNTEFNVTSVSLEENSGRQPIPYVIPPGVDRQQSAVSSGQNIQLNEQALSLQVCGLKDGDSRAAYKEVAIDMRQFERLRMFVHGESRVGQAPLRDGDVRAIIRIGSDFVNNYYEYQVPLKITQPGDRSPNGIWPEANTIDLALNELVRIKALRNERGIPVFLPFAETLPNGNTIVVVGNPNVGQAKTFMLGITNPKQDGNTPGDDGLPKCAEVWFNELRATGLNETPGYAATGKVALQLADLGNVRLSGSMHTQGYGNIDQKVNQRQRDNFYQYDASTNLNAGKLLPQNWGVQLPVFVGYTQSVSTPQYDPYDLDVQLADKLETAGNAARRDSIRQAAQDFTSFTSFNISNARITGDPAKAGKPAKPWSLRNFDATYSYTRQDRHNPLIESDAVTTQRLGLGYTYAVRSKPIEPFKNLVTSKSKWLQPIKDFNFNPVPANFAFRTELRRVFNETQVRTVGEGGYRIDPTYFKDFTWTRTYGTRWEFTKSLALDYNATNNSRIDEPYGPIDNREKRDTVLNLLSRFGRNTFFTHSANASYSVPLSKIPVLDWATVRLNYGTTYSWTGASRLAYNLGNTIGNTQTKTLNAEANLVNLYSKNRWLRAINLPKPKNQDTRGRLGDSKNTDVKEGGKVPESKNNPEPPAGGGEAPTPIRRVKNGPKDSVLLINNAPVVIAGLPDAKVDSLRKIAEQQIAAKAREEKLKKRAARRAARKLKRATNPDVPNAVRVAGRIVTMAKRATLTYSQTGGTILPGYLDSTRFFGVNTQNLQPGLDFAFGYQPGYDWLEQKARGGFLSRDSFFNGQFQQQYARNLNLTGVLEPFPDFRIDLTLTSTFSKNYSEIFKDTNVLYGRTGEFTHNNPFTTGSFNVSGIFLNTLFESRGDLNAPSGVYQQMLANREIISTRLGISNPYTGGVPDPTSPTYQKGYTEYSQEVLVPAFIAAYSGKDAGSVGLINNRATQVSENPYGAYRPLPNWRVTYAGLTKLPAITARFSNLVVSHGYQSSLSMNSFVSSLLYQDVYGLGFPSFIDSNSNNYIPFFQVPNVTITEQFGPLIGIDAALKNNLTLRFEYRQGRTVSLNLLDYQIAERSNTEYVFGLGYRARGLRLPFPILGITKLKNDINIKVDVGYRNEFGTNTFLAQNITQPTSGQKVITISPSIDYIISDQLTFRLFFDRRQSIPYVSSSFPITTTRAGITLRFIFAR